MKYHVTCNITGNLLSHSAENGQNWSISEWNTFAGEQIFHRLSRWTKISPVNRLTGKGFTALVWICFRDIYEVKLSKLLRSFSFTVTAYWILWHFSEFPTRYGLYTVTLCQPYGVVVSGFGEDPVLCHLHGCRHVHPVWFITDTSNFRLVCTLEFPYKVHTTSLI